LEIAQDNVLNLEVGNIVDIINIDVLRIPKSFYKKFDVVLTNPPFGIRSEKGADIKFLKKAMNVLNLINSLIFFCFTLFEVLLFFVLFIFNDSDEDILLYVNLIRK